MKNISYNYFIDNNMILFSLTSHQFLPVLNNFEVSRYLNSKLYDF